MGQNRILPPAPRTWLAANLKDNPALQVLALRENGVSVAAALKDATTLQVLDVGQDRRSAAGPTDLAAALHPLQVLDLRNAAL